MTIYRSHLVFSKMSFTPSKVLELSEAQPSNSSSSKLIKQKNNVAGFADKREPKQKTITLMFRDLTVIDDPSSRNDLVPAVVKSVLELSSAQVEAEKLLNLLPSSPTVKKLPPLKLSLDPVSTTNEKQVKLSSFSTVEKFTSPKPIPNFVIFKEFIQPKSIPDSVQTTVQKPAKLPSSLSTVEKCPQPKSAPNFVLTSERELLSLYPSLSTFKEFTQPRSTPDCVPTIEQDPMNLPSSLSTVDKCPQQKSNPNSVQTTNEKLVKLPSSSPTVKKLPQPKSTPNFVLTNEQELLNLYPSLSTFKEFQPKSTPDCVPTIEQDPMNLPPGLSTVEKCPQPKSNPDSVPTTDEKPGKLPPGLSTVEKFHQQKLTPNFVPTAEQKPAKLPSSLSSVEKCPQPKPNPDSVPTTYEKPIKFPPGLSAIEKYHQAKMTPNFVSTKLKLLNFLPSLSTAKKLPQPISKKIMRKSDRQVAENRLRKELTECKMNPRPGCTVDVEGNNLLEWVCAIEGPRDSPFEGGIFKLRFVFPERYPFQPPKVTFLTKVYHCNVDLNGNISLDILNSNWASSYTVATLMLSIQSFLNDCNPGMPLVPEIAEQFVEDREKHDEVCREWTKKYAS